MSSRLRKAISQPVPFEKVIFVFALIFNIVGVAYIQTFDSFIDELLIFNVLLLAIIKAEKIMLLYATIRVQKKQKD
jgi:hypothetical protein